MFKYSCIIHKNTPELRKKLSDLGHIDVKRWSEKSTNQCDCLYIGGKWKLECFVYQLLRDFKKDEIERLIDCGENEELFLALAAVRDDSDKDQWFVADNPTVIEDYAKWFKCPYDDINEVKFSAYLNEGYTYHKASIEELKEHFK